MTIEEIEALIQGYLAPNDVDGQVFLQGRHEGHTDIACALAKALHCEKEKLSLIGLLRRARNLQEAVMDQLGQIMLLSRNERERLLRKLEKIEKLSKHAWEQVDRNPEEAKELFRMIYFHSK